jgi:hypothetical protein
MRNVTTAVPKEPDEPPRPLSTPGPAMQKDLKEDLERELSKQVKYLPLLRRFSVGCLVVVMVALVGLVYSMYKLAH